MYIGIFGGSFNPPHIAHLIVAETIRCQFGLDRVMWIPSFKPPHKPDRILVSYDHRLEMTERAISGNPSFVVSDIERKLGGISYTVETLETLRREHPDDTLSLIVGGDSFVQFHTWKDPEVILDRVDLIVYHRMETDVNELLDGYADRIRYARAPLLDISSAEIRALCRRGESIRYLVSDPVWDYITRHQLYR